MAAPLSPERWRAVGPYLDRALEKEADARTALVDALRAHDPTLAADLEMLLASHDALDRDGFLGGAVLQRAPSASLAGQVLGAYTLTEPIGQGGMGSVWAAQRSDGRFSGQAAVKLLNASLVARDARGRFRREGDILARLRHPHIAQLLDAGVSPQGQPYLVLERVEGERIDAWCDRRRLGVARRLDLFLDVLAAVAHAHASLVVHRDLKPSNVLVTAEGRVKLLDFGIAKLLGSEGGPAPDLTADGESLLTPEYAAPEQVTGRDVSAATDVYALGVLLYVLLAGRHPARPDAGTPADLVRAILESDPPRLSEAATTGPRAAERAESRGTTPHRLRAALRGDLENVVAKALKKDPAERYPSADAMAEDLRRHLDHLPVRARADSLGYRLRKFVARHRLVLAAASVVVLALATGVGLAVGQARASARERDRALVALRRSEVTNEFSSFLLTEATPSEGRPLTNAELLARGEALVETRFASDPAMRVHLLLILAARYDENSQFDRARSATERAYATSLTVADVDLRGRAACARATTLGEEQRFDEAYALVERTRADLVRSPEAVEADAFCLACEASIAGRRGDGARAVAAMERVVAAEERQRGAAGLRFETLLGLANAYLVDERTASADAAYRRAMALLESHGLAQSRDAAIVHGNWAAMLQNAGQFTRALPIAERAVAIGRSRDTENGASPIALRNLANALCQVGRCGEALPVIEEAVAKMRRAGSPPRLMDVLAQSAGVHAEAGDVAGAQRLLGEAVEVRNALPEGVPLPRAARLDQAAVRVALARGRPAEALEHALQGLARVPEASRDAHETMRLTQVLSEAQLAAGAFADAASSAGRALVLARARLGGIPHSAHVGRALLVLGEAKAGAGDAAGARAALREALTHLEASSGLAAAPTRRAEEQLSRLASAADVR